MDALKGLLSREGLLPCLQVPKVEGMAPASLSLPTSQAVFWNGNNSHSPQGYHEGWTGWCLVHRECGLQ